MSDLMELLYHHVMDTGFIAALNSREYREVSDLAERLEERLRQSLADDSWDTLKKYQDALLEQRDIELEAMFQAAFALSRELR